MPKLSAASQRRLDGAHPLLRKLFTEVARDANITILDSQRGRAAQERAFALGNSRAHFGDSAHNWRPALALDVVPYPIDWTDFGRFKVLGALVTVKAKAMGIPISWGGRWTKLKDYPHYELTPWRDYAKKSKPFEG